LCPLPVFPPFLMPRQNPGATSVRPPDGQRRVRGAWDKMPKLLHVRQIDVIAGHLVHLSGQVSCPEQDIIRTQPQTGMCFWSIKP